MSRKQRKRRHRAIERGDAKRREQWAARTGARPFEPAEFKRFKSDHALHLLGVMGFAGSWKRKDNSATVAQETRAAAMHALRHEFQTAAARHGSALVVVSGATNQGTLELVYTLCAELHIRAMGIAPHAALQHTLGSMQYVLPFGERFGDESELFVSTCDAFLLLGGGAQSRRETIDAHRRGKPITIVTGFGGASDAFSQNELPNAHFVHRRRRS